MQNIEFATEGRFRPRGLAESAPAVGDDGPMPAPGPAPQAAQLPRGRVGLLLHEDDLHAESLELGAAEVVAVATPAAGEARSTLAGPTAPLVAGFTAAALADGRARAGAHYGAEASALDGLTASAIRDWANDYDLAAIVTPYAPVGPVRDRLDQLGRELNDDLPLTRVLRPWDALAWPHATRGFFPFRERIPALLREQQIGP